MAASDGSQTAYVWYRDAAGNVSDRYSATVLRDTVNPSGSAAFTAGFTSGDSAALSLGSTDSLSGIASMRVSSNSAYSDSGWEPFSGTKTWNLATADGTQTAYVWYRDNAGNLSPSYSATIVRDTVKPTGSASFTAAVTGADSASLNLEASDALSGVASMRLSANSAFADTGWESYNASRTWPLATADGAQTVYVWFRDNAGNVSDSYSSAITRDTGAPSGSISFTSAYSTGNGATLIVTATDSGSGVVSMRFSTGAAYADTGWEDYAASKDWTLTAADGTQTVYAWFKDAIGNVSPRYSAAITRDTVGPAVIAVKVGSGAANPSPATTSYIDITVSPDADTSAFVAYASPGATPNATFKVYATASPSFYYFPASLSVSTEAGTGNKIVRYSFARKLSFNTQYTIETRGASSGTGGLKDLAGNVLGTTQTATFTTKTRTLTLSAKRGEIIPQEDFGSSFYFRDMILSEDGTRLYGITNPRSGYSYGRVFSVNLQNSPDLQQSDLDIFTDLPTTSYTPWNIRMKDSALYVSAENDYTYALQASTLDYIRTDNPFTDGKIPVPAASGLAIVSPTEIMGAWYPASNATGMSTGNLLNSGSSGYYSSGFGNGNELGAAAAYSDTLIYASSFVDMEEIPYLDVVNLDFSAGGPGGSSFVQQYGFTKNDNSSMVGFPTSLELDMDSAVIYAGLTGTSGYGLSIFGGLEDVSYADTLFRAQTMNMPDTVSLSLGASTSGQRLNLNYEALLALAHGSAGNTGGSVGTKGFSLVGVNPIENGTRSVLSYSGAMESNGKYAWKILIRNIDGFTYDIYVMRGATQTTIDAIEVYRLTVN